MSEITKISKKSGKIANKLSINAGEAFQKMMKSAGKKASKLYGEKPGLKARIKA